MKRTLSIILAVIMVVLFVPMTAVEVMAADNLPVLDHVSEYSAKSSTAIKTLSNMMNASSNAKQYTDLLKRAGGYAALVGGSIDALRGAIKAYDKNDPWYENIWNIGSGAVAGFLGLKTSGASIPAIQYDFDEMKSMIESMDKDIQEINGKLDNLETTIQTNFEELSSKIINKIQEAEYKQFLNEFTQVNDRNAFSYYSFFKPGLNQRYNELLIALEAGNNDNIKQAYDNLYSIAIQSEQLYYYISGERNALTGKQSIQDILYDYSLLSSEENFELTCVGFAEDLNSTFIFAQYCLSLCYNYQLLYAQMNEQPYDAYYYIQQNDTSIESIQYSSITSKVSDMLNRQNIVTRNIAKYMCKVLRLSGEFDYSSRDIRFGSIPYTEMSENNIFGSEPHKTLNGSTVYYRTNNNLQYGDTIQICEMPDAYMAMFNPQGFNISVSNGNAILSNSVVKVVGSSGSFDVIYSYDGVECYRVSFNIVSKYSGGLGIENAPYLISTGFQFDNIRNQDAQCYYLLINDINYSGSQIRCLSISSGGFGGILDGGGHKVYNYRITSSGTYDSNGSQLNYSLFPIIKQNAVIKNLTVGDLDCNTYSGYSVLYEMDYSRGGYSLSVYNGILSGINEGIISNCNIQNVRVNAKIAMPSNGSYFWSLDAFVGGFAADNRGTIAHSAISKCNLTGRYYSNQAPCRLYIGGIAGMNRNVVSNCFSLDNSILAETTASSLITPTQSLIYGGNIVGKHSGSIRQIYGENCSLTMNPYGSHERATFRGVDVSSVPSADQTSYVKEINGWMDRGDGKPTIDFNLTKEMCNFVLPHKTIYYYGESLNLTGMELYYGNKIYQDLLGVNNKSRAYDFKISGYNSNVIGTQTVTLTYDDLSMEFDVTVLCPHQWENGYESINPSHTEYGIYTETCSICGETKETTIDKLSEHEFSSWSSFDSEEHQKACGCGYVIKENHNWDEGVLTTPATHIAAGVMTYTCLDCNVTKNVEIPKLSGHTHSGWEKLNDEQHQKVCECGDTIIEDHDWKHVESKVPTCTEIGWYAYAYCENCDYSSYVEIPANGHRNTTIIGYVAPTCTSIGFTGSTFCHDCKTTVENSKSIPAIGHQNTEIINYKENSCADDGYTGDTYCYDCESILEYGEIIPATGHRNTESFGYVAPTCTDPGYTGAVYCFDCNTTIQNGEIIPAAHLYEDGACIHCGEPEFTEPEIPSVIPGDANGDGSVDAADLQLLQRYIAGLSAEMDEIAADANGDGNIDAADTMIISRTIAGLSV